MFSNYLKFVIFRRSVKTVSNWRVHS